MESYVVSPHSPRLPFELYAIILAHLPSPIHTPELCALALTSKTLSGEAIPELYRSVECWDSQTVEFFTGCILESSFARRGPGFGSLVHELTLCLTSSKTLELYSEIEDDPLLRLTRDALSLLPNLKVLNLYNDDNTISFPQIPISWLFERTTLRLTHLFIRFSFIYDLDFEAFLIRHSHTLRHIQFLDLELVLNDDDVRYESQERLEALDSIAAPGNCIRRILKCSRPKKIWNLDYDPEFGQIVPATAVQQNITSYKFSVSSSVSLFALAALVSNLRFLGLEVKVDNENEGLYQPLLSLNFLRTLEIEWVIVHHEKGVYTTKLASRLQGIILSCFAICPSSHFNLVFSSVTEMGGWRKNRKKWVRGVKESVPFAQFDDLWSTDW